MVLWNVSNAHSISENSVPSVRPAVHWGLISKGPWSAPVSVFLQGIELFLVFPSPPL